MPFCWKCGKDVGTNNFCGGCGSTVVKSDPSVKKVQCNGKGCIEDDIGYAPTQHGRRCPMSSNYSPYSSNYP